MNVNFICPCCGHFGQITKKLCELISDVVDDYIRDNEGWEIDYKVAQGKKTLTTEAPTAARMWKIYFIRRMTGATNKEIAPMIHTAASVLASYYGYVEDCIAKNTNTEICQQEMLQTIVQRYVQLAIAV
jgi:hypothetical protein